MVGFFGFNGAATFQSRKLTIFGAVSRMLSRFNGAATFQSRKPDGRVVGAEYVVRLQWGRDLSVAETPAAANDPAAGAMLQWGRDLSVAETSCCC